MANADRRTLAEFVRGASEKRPRIKLRARDRTSSVRSEIAMTTTHSAPLHVSGPGLISSLWTNLAKKEAAPSVVVDVEADEMSGEFTTMEGPSPPADGNLSGFFDSESVGGGDVLRVKIVKEQVKQDLMDLMRTQGGNVRALEELESETCDATAVFGDCSQADRDVAALWCAFVRRPEALAALLALGADVSFCEPAEGFSALHLAAFSGCTASVRLLLAAGADANRAPQSYAPLHLAAFGNAPATAQLLVEGGGHVTATTLRSAVAAGAVDCVRYLVARCDDVNAVDRSGAAALHVAADLGNEACLCALLEAEGADVNVQTQDRRNTAAHVAAEGGNVACLAALIARGADVNATNAKGQTPLHLAARVQSLECVDVLLGAGRANPAVTDADLRTPLHCALGRAPHAVELAETLLKAWRGGVNAADRFGHAPLHTAANKELSQCVNLLLRHGADVTARTKGGVTALNLIVKKTPACLATVGEILDRAISLHDPENSRQEVELKMNFRCILPRRGQRDRSEIGFLNTFLEEGQKEFLQHPLCEAFLYLKWEKVRKYYVWRLIYCGLFVVWLTAYVMNALVHDSCSEGRNGTEPQPMAEANSSMKLCEGFVYKFVARNPSLLEVQWYVLLVMTLLEFCRKMYGVAGYLSCRQYFSEMENYWEWFVIGGAIAISCVFKGHTVGWQNSVAAFVVLFAWINLMYRIGQLPALGSYLAMYTKVLREFAKLLLAYACLLVGFLASFCVLFPTNREFANPLIGFVHVLVMMTGEVSLEQMFKVIEDNGDLHWLLYLSTYVVYSLFLLLVTIVLMNLLVGIAVNDIQGLKKTAGLSRLVQQTHLINYIERSLFHKLLPEYVKNVLSSTALFAYRVVLELKPLNPRENRLPKEILAMAYDRAKNLKQGGSVSRGDDFKYNANRRATYQPKRSLVHKFGKQVSVESLQIEVEEGSLALSRLANEVREIKELMKGLVEALAKKEGNDKGLGH